MHSILARLAFFLGNIRRSKFLGNALFIAATISCILQFATYFQHRVINTDDAIDTAIYYIGARRAVDRPDIYSSQPYKDPYHSDGVYYSYLPYFAALTFPLSKLPYPIFYRLWSILLLISYGFFVYLLALLFYGKGNVTVRGVLIWGCALFLWPGSSDGLFMGNIDPLLWALATAGLLFSSRLL